MSLSEIEQTLFSHYVANGANDLVIAGRFYPYGELILIIEDKVKVGARKFGFKVTGKAKAAGTAFLDHMIAKGAWSTTQNDFGGTMHQFQTDAYKVALRELQASDAIVQQAAAGGETFWADTFAALTA
jgi:hypothetical protein